MAIMQLRPRPGLVESSKTWLLYENMVRLLSAAGGCDLKPETEEVVNAEVARVNGIAEADRALGRALERSHQAMLKVLREQEGLVPRNYHRTTWTALGMAVFGVPLGVAFGLSLDNMAFIGIGLPIGLALGAGVGTALDKKAAEAGKQLDVEM